jgi:transposase
MHTTTIVGLDISKSVFQVHGIDADGNVVVRRQLKRRYVLTFFQKLLPLGMGAKVYADLCSVAATGRLAGRSALAAIRDALTAPAPERTAA